MKRALLIGSVGCGKTTLLQRLQDRDLTYLKTQAITLEGTVLDSPGEYLEHTFYRHALRLASFESDVVVLLEAADAAHTKLPPAFTTFFTKPVIGVVTKTDLATPAQVARAREHLQLAGALEIHEVSAVTGHGIPTLLAALH